MRRITLMIFFIVALALTLSVSASELSAVDDLAALARYAPEDSVLFAAMRIDDEFIDTIQALQNRTNEVLSQIPFANPENLNIQDVLDWATMQVLGAVLLKRCVRGLVTMWPSPLVLLTSANPM